MRIHRPQEGHDFWSQKIFERLKTTVEPNSSCDESEMEVCLHILPHSLACSMLERGEGGGGGGYIHVICILHFNYMFNALGIL